MGVVLVAAGLSVFGGTALADTPAQGPVAAAAIQLSGGDDNGPPEKRGPRPDHDSGGGKPDKHPPPHRGR